jgi:hypothetical protein
MQLQVIQVSLQDMEVTLELVMEHYVLFVQVLQIVAIVITEISSAQGDKNSASSAQKNSHSWHKD